MRTRAPGFASEPAPRVGKSGERAEELSEIGDDHLGLLEREEVPAAVDLRPVNEDNPRHRRAKLLRITPKGLGALREIQDAQRDWADRLGAELGKDELERASATLELPSLRAPKERREAG